MDAGVKMNRATFKPQHGPDDVKARPLMELARKLLGLADVSQVLSLAMDEAIQASGAERGMIILIDDGGQILIEAARNLEQRDLEDPENEISHKIIKAVAASGTPVCLKNALEDGQYKRSASVLRLRLLSVLCLPLVYGKTFGVLYLDNRKLTGIFSDATAAFMGEFADFISRAAFRTLERRQLECQISYLESELRQRYRFDSIVGHDPKLLEVLRVVAQVADTHASVLIQGESGTGKELIARALHYNSRRRDNLFYALNCAAIPENLLESELFGYVKGAFTGATRDRHGCFGRADGGTIFLDEIGDMPLTLQSKLLRILQTGEYSPLGSDQLCHCDVRIVAATSKNLQKWMESGNFRQDLFYRLNVVDLQLPPIRERRGDILALIYHFLGDFCRQAGKPPLRLAVDAEAALLVYDYPGNIREIENIIQRAVVLAEDDSIELRHLPEKLTRSPKRIRLKPAPTRFKEAKQEVVESFERQFLQQCLSESGGNISLAARRAGMHIKNFFAKMQKYEIDRHLYRPRRRAD